MHMIYPTYASIFIMLGLIFTLCAFVEDKDNFSKWVWVKPLYAGEDSNSIEVYNLHPYPQHMLYQVMPRTNNN